MDLIKANITSIITVTIAVVLLALQRPISNHFVQSSQDGGHLKPSTNYSIINTWKLPSKLNEISGMVWLSDNVFACIQDEDGILFIYDISKNNILEEIKFADAGDYESVAINDNDAYVMRSDGLIYEIKNFESKSRQISEIHTPFKSSHNIESLTFDKESSRLLTIPKDKDFENDNLKCIYQIPLSSRKMNKDPIIEINLKDEKLKYFQQSKIRKTLNPSEIAIHPKSKDIYILEGKNPKLLILKSTGKIKQVIKLNDQTFAQPEGITFSSDGKLYIANEANSENANILEVQLH